jgi:hypothetical protein
VTIASHWKLLGMPHFAGCSYPLPRDALVAIGRATAGRSGNVPVRDFVTLRPTFTPEMPGSRVRNLGSGNLYAEVSKSKPQVAIGTDADLLVDTVLLGSSTGELTVNQRLPSFRPASAGNRRSKIDPPAGCSGVRVDAASGCWTPAGG